MAALHVRDEEDTVAYSYRLGQEMLARRAEASRKDLGIYALFMALGASLLREHGLACFLVPRSFCSGAYFSAFRADFIANNVPTHVHVFEARDAAFRSDAVLQESIVFAFRKRLVHESGKGEVLITASTGTEQLAGAVWGRCIDMGHFLADKSGALFFRLPVTELDEAIVAAIDAWPNSLARSDLNTSTGPVVAFRAASALMDAQDVSTGKAAPFLWMHNVRAQEVAWPVERENKPQAIAVGAKRLLTPVCNYVLLRRFSAKEERRRLIAAPLLRQDFGHEWVGLENHLNYLYKERGELSPNEAIGLSALLNSALLDRYFRVANGNTQVNAQEIRSLPLPPLGVICEIGRLAASLPDRGSLNSVVFSVLRADGRIKARYGRDYAENRRKTIRRQVLHQFEQAGLVERNPDDPSLATNSPRTHYALAVATIEALRAYGSAAWSEAASRFLEEQRNLIEIYRKEREQLRIPLHISDDVEYHLSPGPHNRLQAAVIEEFGPRFAPGARVLYVGDAARKTLHFDQQASAALGMVIDSHDKLPDIVLLDEERNWLYLIEAVTTHGPISAKRRLELEKLAAGCDASLVFVTVVPDFSAFKDFVAAIAWETEVWIADTPSHLIHFNGERFRGPS